MFEQKINTFHQDFRNLRLNEFLYIWEVQNCDADIFSMIGQKPATLQKKISS